MLLKHSAINKFTFLSVLQSIFSLRTVKMWMKFLIILTLFSSSFQSEFFECSHILEHKDLKSSGIPLKSASRNVCKISNVHEISDLNEIFEMKKDFSSVGVIYVGNSTLLKMPTIIFNKIPNLLTFSASNVQLMQIYRDDFQDAHNLNTLILSKNSIKELEDGIFSHPRKLRKLDLSNNLITFINEETFKGCSDDLRQVDLSYNKIYNLDYSSLIPLAHEKNFPLELNLDSNQIKEIRESHNVHHLHFDILSLKNNQLETFTCPDVKIETLHLDNNLLNAISLDNCSIEYMVGFFLNT